MNDLIRREDAIAEICKARTPDVVSHQYAELFINAVRRVPSADRPQEWIPCSERMPENGNYYLWCSDMGNVQSDYYWNGFDKERKYGYNIVAWMPLPKPYGERKEDE